MSNLREPARRYIRISVDALAVVAVVAAAHFFRARSSRSSFTDVGKNSTTSTEGDGIDCLAGIGGLRAVAVFACTIVVALFV